MLHRIRKLQEISDQCRCGGSLTRDNAAWLADHLERFLRHQCPSLEDAFGLHAPRGGVPWWRDQAIRERDEALRHLAVRFFSDLSVTAQARAIEQLSLRYAASRWRFDRDADEMPEYYRRTPKECLWRAFKSGATMPIGERHLRSIIRD